MPGQPLVVNLFAGPSSGKSTMAAGLFYHLKCQRANVEYATEYAKDLTHDERHRALEDQVYVFGKQQQRIQRLTSHYDVIIADSPVLMGLVYSAGYPDCFRETVAWRFRQYDSMNFFINRCTEYDPIGRNQTEAQAREKDGEIRQLLADFEVEYHDVDGNEDGLLVALEKIKARLR
jgi:nicotinamide riboside kinase